MDIPTMSQTTKKVGGIVIAIFLMAASIAVEVNTISTFLVAKEAESWPTAPGKITKSELLTEFHGSVSYKASIEYEYSINGTQHTSNKVRTRGISTKHRSDVAQLVEKYRAGQQVPVYYNPSNPAEGYLE